LVAAAGVAEPPPRRGELSRRARVRRPPPPESWRFAARRWAWLPPPLADGVGEEEGFGVVVFVGPGVGDELLLPLLDGRGVTGVSGTGTGGLVSASPTPCAVLFTVSVTPVTVWFTVLTV
jgi:hypothetical protein